MNTTFDVQCNDYLTYNGISHSCAPIEYIIIYDSRLNACMYVTTKVEHKLLTIRPYFGAMSICLNFVRSKKERLSNNNAISVHVYRNFLSY